MIHSNDGGQPNPADLAKNHPIPSPALRAGQGIRQTGCCDAAWPGRQRRWHGPSGTPLGGTTSPGSSSLHAPCSGNCAPAYDRASGGACVRASGARGGIDACPSTSSELQNKKKQRTSNKVKKIIINNRNKVGRRVPQPVGNPTYLNRPSTQPPVRTNVMAGASWTPRKWTSVGSNTGTAAVQVAAGQRPLLRLLVQRVVRVAHRPRT